MNKKANSLFNPRLIVNPSKKVFMYKYKFHIYINIYIKICIYKFYI
jgi:hypothetical protein